MIATYFAGLTGLQDVFVFDMEEGPIVLAAPIACVNADPSACPNLKTLEFSFKARSHESGGDVDKEGEEEELKFLKLLKSFLIVRPDIVVQDKVGVSVGNDGPGV